VGGQSVGGRLVEERSVGERPVGWEGDLTPLIREVVGAYIFQL
jgi:hypothetical protein